MRKHDARKDRCDESMVSLTVRELAAIELGVPDSGNDKLNAMIWESRRMNYAGQAMQGLIANGCTREWGFEDLRSGSDTVAAVSHTIAHAMLAEWRKWNDDVQSRTTNPADGEQPAPEASV